MTKITTEIYRAFQNYAHPKMAEQDWLECNILAELFGDAYFGDNFVFTGGGTLNKTYRLSTRHGHDIDLACADFTDIPDNHSKAALNNFRRQFKDFVFDVLRSKINYIINRDGRFMIVTDRDWRVLQTMAKGFSNPCLHFLYKSTFQSDLGHLCIEFIPRKYDTALVAVQPVIPYATGHAIGKIPTLCYEQTFWDKVYALHSGATMPSFNPHETYSRHYYDLANMSEIVDIAKTAPLLKNTMAYQSKYTCKNIEPVKDISEIQLIPNAEMLGRLDMDYQTRIAPYTRTPWAWCEIVHRLKQLNTRIRGLKQYGG